MDGSDPQCLMEHHGTFDFILSTLHVTFDLDPVVRMLTPQGQLCLVAAPLERLSLSGGQLNNSRRSISGNYIGSRAETVRMLEFAATHDIEAVVDVMPLARVNEAIDRIRKREVEIGLVLESLSLVSGIRDFDFIIGRWRVRHRQLRERLASCDEWIAFDGEVTTRKILGGHGNLEEQDVPLPGDPYRAVALRAFDAASGEWSIWWLDGRYPRAIDVPVVGRFEDGVGTFYADDTFRGQRVKIRFLWFAGAVPRWEQAFSGDGGVTWETNWTMEFARVQ